ncbi:hypothetical protein [Rhizobium leguminosarum]|uniref:hypothetical protein n=1 Tax=Rhizobium leguminosarum TaxID=384 RepID=UPI0024A8C1BE|nr:hypothetical protein [Rhizobium leguminosarum]MDI5929139.1 hypothetical protein [Rhizobium leguminosarum]
MPAYLVHSTVVGAAMSGYSLAAGPITMGAALAIFALAYAASERRKFLRQSVICRYRMRIIERANQFFP